MHHRELEHPAANLEYEAWVPKQLTPEENGISFPFLKNRLGVLRFSNEADSRDKRVWKASLDVLSKLDLRNTRPMSNRVG